MKSRTIKKTKISIKWMMNDVCIKHFSCFKKPTIKTFSRKLVLSSGLHQILHQIKKQNKQ